jgi:hypothetical protein
LLRPERPVGDGREGSGRALVFEVGSLSRIQRGLGCLWAYTREHGVARPPAVYVTADGFRLGRWVVSRRHERGRDPARDALLETLPGWTWNTRELRFEERLRQFSMARGSGGLSGDRVLRGWAVRQWRAAATGELSKRKLEQLEGAGVLAFASAHASRRKGVHQRGQARTRPAESGTRQREMQSISDEKGEGHG